MTESIHPQDPLQKELNFETQVNSATPTNHQDEANLSEKELIEKKTNETLKKIIDLPDELLVEMLADKEMQKKINRLMNEAKVVIAKKEEEKAKALNKTLKSKGVDQVAWSQLRNLVKSGFNKERESAAEALVGKTNINRTENTDSLLSEVLVYLKEKSRVDLEWANFLIKKGEVIVDEEDVVNFFLLIKERGTNFDSVLLKTVSMEIANADVDWQKVDTALKSKLGTELELPHFVLKNFKTYGMNQYVKWKLIKETVSACEMVKSNPEFFLKEIMELECDSKNNYNIYSSNYQTNPKEKEEKNKETEQSTMLKIQTFRHLIQQGFLEGKTLKIPTHHLNGFVYRDNNGNHDKEMETPVSFAAIISLPIEEASIVVFKEVYQAEKKNRLTFKERDAVGCARIYYILKKVQNYLGEGHQNDAVKHGGSKKWLETILELGETPEMLLPNNYKAMINSNEACEWLSNVQTSLTMKKVLNGGGGPVYAQESDMKTREVTTSLKRL